MQVNRIFWYYIIKVIPVQIWLAYIKIKKPLEYLKK